MNKSDSYACKRLSDQLKFFGLKPKRFVSIYAKKPRIRVGNKTRPIIPGQSFDISPGQKHLTERANESLMRNAAGMACAGMASRQAAMAQQIGAQQAFAAQRGMLSQQQGLRPNVGLSNIGQAGLNSLTGGIF